MEVLYNFKKYNQCKIGVFKITTDEYRLPGGWVCKEEQLKIIGECDLFYVEKLQLSKQGEWIGNQVVYSEFILPIGIHKSRLVKWIGCQLSLFD